MHICLLGLTGAGKTTLAAALSERLRLPHVSAGEIARTLAASDPHTAVALDKGRMAPEAAMRSMMARALEHADLSGGGWVLEGFPRDLAQLVCLMDWTSALPTFVHLDVDEFTVIERLTARRRGDDTPDAIARRIKDFHDNVVPVLAILEGGGVLHTMTKTWDQDQVIEYIEETLCP